MANSTGEVGRWNGHKFIVSSKLIRSFTGLQVKGASETENKDKNKQSYVSRKKGKPTEISLTVRLHAMTGCDVRTEALAFVKEAQSGKKDYFYLGNKKLVTYKLILTDASVKEVAIAANGTWVSADVQLSLKQAGTGSTSAKKKKGSGSGGSKSKSGSQKKSVKTSSTVVSSGQNQVLKNNLHLLNEVKKIISNAKKYSGTKKALPATGGKMVMAVK